MWKFWIFVSFFAFVGCRRIHKPDSREESVFSERDDLTSTGIKTHATEESFDLDNCTDCETPKPKHLERKPDDSELSLKKETPSSKRDRDLAADNVKRKGNEQIKNNSGKIKQKKRTRPKKNKKAKKKKKGRKKEKSLDKGPKSDRMLPDAVDNMSRYRWRDQRLKQLPEVARLEQRLHPTVRNPIHNMMMAMDRILQTLSHSVRMVDRDHSHMFNATRYEIMMGVRKELKTIADENDKAYDAVLQASLLTKDIYRRAHRQRLLGPRTIPAAVSSDTMPKLRKIPLREQYLYARDEVQRAEQLKHRIALAERERYALESRLMQVQRQVEGRLPARVLRDLIRISNQTLRVLHTFSPTFGVGGRAPLYAHMHRNSMENLNDARNMMHDAKNILTEAKSQIMIGRNLRNQIQRRVRDGNSGTLSDMPFDDGRMMLWAIVDSARLHAEKLASMAADIHMKLSPILERAKKVLADKDKNKLSRRIDDTARELRQKIKSLHRTMDKIRVIIGNEDILRSRCEDIRSSALSIYDDDSEIIDCDAYISILEGSGTVIEGSGDLEDTKVDVEIPLDEKSGKIGMSSSNTTETKNNTILFSEGSLSRVDVVRATDDEDILSKQAKPQISKTVTSSETTAESIAEEDTEEDGFTFTDFFGFLGDDPLAGDSNKIPLRYRGVLQSPITFNTSGKKFGSMEELGSSSCIKRSALILTRLANYSKESVEVFKGTDKTKEDLQDLKIKWNRTRTSIEKFENNTLATKVFLHDWAAKKLYFDAVHDRVISIKDVMDIQSGLIEKQCSAAIDVAEKKLEEAEDRKYRQSASVDTAADPEDARVALESVARFTEDVKEIVKLKKVYPVTCNNIQNLDSALKTNISELRKKIEKAKLIASSLQVPVSLKDGGYLKLPLPKDETKSPSLTLAMNAKPGNNDGPIASVKTEESGSMVLSTKNSKPKLTVFDGSDYNIGELTADTEIIGNETYRITANRLGSLFSLFVYSLLDNNIISNNSMLISSVNVYQNRPSFVYVAGTPNNFPTFGSSSWDGCISHVSVNGKYLSLLKNDSKGNMPETCSERSFLPWKESLVLGGTGYARLALDPSSNLNRGAMDNMMIRFKAYSDGILLHLESSSARSVESIQIENERIKVNFKNHYGQAILQSKDGTFLYGTENILQITVKQRRQLDLDVSLNGNTDSFEKKNQVTADMSLGANAFYIGGLPLKENSSLSGCIQKLLINEQEVTFSNAEESHNVYYGTCEESYCVRFVNDSLPVNLGESDKRNLLTFAFTYGSTGTIIEYTKSDKVKLTINIDSDGLDIYEAEEETSERIYLQDHSEGDVITVTIKASTTEVEVKADGISKVLSYDGGWALFSNEENAKYSIIVGGTLGEDTDTKFQGNLIDFFMNGRPIATESYIESNNLLRCATPSRRREDQSKWREESDGEEEGRKIDCGP